MANQKDELTGVGGWLGFLIISLIFIGPFFGFGTTLNGLEDAEAAFPQLVGAPAYEQYKLITWGAFLTQAILSIHAGVRLYRETMPGAVRYAIFMLWFFAIGLNLLYVLEPDPKLS